jgi:ABC-type transport system substrate-binding protein
MRFARRRAAPLAFTLLMAVVLAACLGENITGLKDSRLANPIVFKVNGSSAPTLRYAAVIENSLRGVGIPVQIDAVEFNTLQEQQQKGQVQMTTGRWVGGNQDPVFLWNLFRTGGNFNRGRYSNPELDTLLTEAANTFERPRARELYVRVQDTLSRELPMFPLWYAAQMVVARRNVGNIKVDSSGDWRFIRDLTADGKTGPFVVALESPPRTLDQLRGNDASSERIRQLVYNSLVKKNEQFDYVGDLATDIRRADDGLSYTFTLRDGVKFHSGKAFTSADVKHTLETLLTSDSPKATDFFEGVASAGRKLYENGYLTAIDTPDAKTVVVRLRQPWLNLIPNLVPVGIIPQGSTGDQQRQQPVGTGFYKFVRYDESQQTIDLAAHDAYWGGAPALKALRVRVILDANTLQAELKSGGIDLAVVGNLQPEDYQVLGQDSSLQVKQFPGANVVYLLFNAEDPVLKDARVRQAIAYSVDREKIVSQVLLNQARVAHSILPPESWAYHQGQTFNFDPERSKRILDEAGHTGQ